MLRLLFSTLLFCVTCVAGKSQGACTTLGQTPATAFPVCGTTVFTQQTVPLCSGGKTIAKNCPSPTYDIANPFWYKFTCYQAGKLGFVITPLNPQNIEDYDWQLYDITGRNPGDIYTDASMIVCASWVGTYGPTGASAAGTSLFGCASQPAQNLSAFTSMPDLQAGHEYLLLVSHFLSPGFSSEIGYNLSFQSSTDGSGGLAVITDPAKPDLKNSYGVCDGTEVVMVLSKKMKCNTLAADGSDFTISGPGSPVIIAATGGGCSTGFDMDTVRLRLNRPLSLGTYQVTSRIGSDGNSLGDNCGVMLATGLQTSMQFTPAQPTPMDSITPVVCIKDTLQLIFRKPMQCSSIAPDGSDFIITGPSPVTVKSAGGICANGVSTTVRLVLAAPVRTNGTFTITLKNGSDGNTLLDECAEATHAGSTISFTTKNITDAAFTATVAPGCKTDTLLLSHNGNNGALSWEWKIDDNPYSTARTASLVSKSFGTHNASLKVSNGFCTDTSSQQFVLPDHTVKAGFICSDTLCPEGPLSFTDQSSSNAISWRWSFGNGSTGTARTVAPQYYPQNGRLSQYTVSLEVGNAYQCTDIAYKIVTVLGSCYIAVPSAFTPNGDGRNDYLYPINAFKATNIEFRVYNRSGQVLFESRHFSGKWDGRFKGDMQPSGTYVWTFSYTDPASNERVNLKGTTALIR